MRPESWLLVPGVLVFWVRARPPNQPGWFSPTKDSGPGSLWAIGGVRD
jgi:hypothetical protein